MLLSNIAQIICFLALILTTAARSHHAEKSVKHHGEGKPGLLSYEDKAAPEELSKFLRFSTSIKPTNTNHLEGTTSVLQAPEDTSLRSKTSQKFTGRSSMTSYVDERLKRSLLDEDGEQEEISVVRSGGTNSGLSQGESDIRSYAPGGTEPQFSNSFQVFGDSQMVPSILPQTPPQQPYSPMTSSIRLKRMLLEESEEEDIPLVPSGGVNSESSQGDFGMGPYNQRVTQQKHSFHASQYTNGMQSSSQSLGGSMSLPSFSGYSKTGAIQATPSVKTLQSSIQSFGNPRRVSSSIGDSKRGSFQDSQNTRNVRGSSRSFEDLKTAPSILGEPVTNSFEGFVTGEMTAPSNSDLPKSASESISGGGTAAEASSSDQSLKMTENPRLSSGSSLHGMEVPFVYYGLKPWRAMYDTIPGGWGPLPMVPMAGNLLNRYPKIKTVIKPHYNYGGFANGMALGTERTAINFVNPLEHFIYREGPLLPYYNMPILPTLDFGLGSGLHTATSCSGLWGNGYFNSVLGGGGNGLWVPLLNHQHFQKFGRPTHSSSESGKEDSAIKAESTQSPGRVGASQTDEKDSGSRYGSGMIREEMARGLSTFVKKSKEPFQSMTYDVPKPPRVISATRNLDV